MDHMSRSNYFIAFACSEAAPAACLACLPKPLVPLDPNPGEDPVAGREASVPWGEACGKGCGEGWGSFADRPKTRELQPRFESSRRRLLLRKKLSLCWRVIAAFDYTPQRSWYRFLHESSWPVSCTASLAAI